MSHLDDLLDQLEKARACEKAAAMDVCDRADDHRLTKDRLDKATQAHEAAKAIAEQIRRRIDFVIDMRAESDLDAAPEYKPTVPCPNLGQFTHYGMLEGPEQ